MVCIERNRDGFNWIDLDAEDRLNKANDDLKRVTEHIEQERRQSEFNRQLPPNNRNCGKYIR